MRLSLIADALKKLAEKCLRPLHLQFQSRAEFLFLSLIVSRQMIPLETANGEWIGSSIVSC